VIRNSLSRNSVFSFNFVRIPKEFGEDPFGIASKEKLLPIVALS